MSRLYPSTVAGKTLRWLLTIEWGGLVIRLSDDQVDVERADGTWLQYDGGLQSVDVSEAISLTGDSVGQLSIPLEFFAPPGQSIAERIARGDDFSAARGELARWVEGSTYEERRVVLVGRLADPEYGSDDEPISTSDHHRPTGLGIHGHRAAGLGAGISWPLGRSPRRLPGRTRHLPS